MEIPIRLQHAVGDAMTVYRAPAQKEQLLAALDAATALELDLSQVSEIDAAGLQLLLFIKREAQRAGKGLTLVAHSPAVRELLVFTRLDAYFGDPMVIPRGEAER